MVVASLAQLYILHHRDALSFGWEEVLHLWRKWLCLLSAICKTFANDLITDKKSNGNTHHRWIFLLLIHFMPHLPSSNNNNQFFSSQCAICLLCGFCSKRNLILFDPDQISYFAEFLGFCYSIWHLFFSPMMKKGFLPSNINVNFFSPL